VRRVSERVARSDTAVSVWRDGLRDTNARKLHDMRLVSVVMCGVRTSTGPAA